MIRKLNYKLAVLSFVLLFSISAIAQDNINYSEDSQLVINETQTDPSITWGESLNAAGDWCSAQTFPDLPAVTYFQAAVWLGDTLYVQTPTTTGGPSSTIIKYTVGGSWTAGTPLPASLTGGAMVNANNKLFYLGGGATSITTGPVNTVYQYDPSTGSWTTMAPMPVALSAHSAVVWGDSVIFVVGGPYTGSGTNLAVHYYRIATNSWNTISNSLPPGQGRRTFALGISGNKIIMSGGFNTAFLKSTYFGNIGSNASQITWTSGPDVPTIWTGLSRPGGAAIDKYFFIVCGEAGGSPTSNRYYDTTHVMDVQLEQWVDIVNNKPYKMSNIFNGVAPRLHGDTIKVYVPGGYGSVSGATPGTGSAFFDVIGCGDLIVIPVELTSFTASVIDGNVNLNWQTASETNNYGFEVERKAAGQQFTKVGFVAGYGTTTETKNYSYVDNSVSAGKYTYRLRQVDFDGTFEYSDEVEVDFAPSAYSLAQNYPNPFNPATKIEFSLASDSKVTLKIFDILGQEVATVINGNLNAGIHNFNFDAASLNSGVYVYTIDAKGVDGTNFTSSKKMILAK